MFSGHHSEPINIDVGNAFEPPAERNLRRERTLSKFLDALNDNEVGRNNPGEVDPIGSLLSRFQHRKINFSTVPEL